MFGIILAAVAAVLCFIACIGDFIMGKPGVGFAMGLLVLMNIYILIVDIKKYNEPKELHREQIEEVVKDDIDSTTVINGLDTTKTYTIYYYKY